MPVPRALNFFKRLGGCLLAASLTALPGTAQEQQFLDDLSVGECRMWRDFHEFAELGVFGDEILRQDNSTVAEFWSKTLRCSRVQQEEEIPPFSGRSRQENKRLLIEFTERLAQSFDYRNVITLVRQSKSLIEEANRNAPDPDLSVLIAEAQQALRYSRELLVTRTALERSGQEVLQNLRGALVTLTTDFRNLENGASAAFWPSHMEFGKALGVRIETFPFRRTDFNLLDDEDQFLRKTAQMHYVRFIKSDDTGALPDMSMSDNITEVLRDRKVILCEVNNNSPAACVAKEPLEVLDPTVLRPPGARDAMERLINEAEAINYAIRTVYDSLSKEVARNIDRIEVAQAAHCEEMSDLRDDIRAVLQKTETSVQQPARGEGEAGDTIVIWLSDWAREADCRSASEFRAPPEAVSIPQIDAESGLSEALDQIAYSFTDSGDLSPQQLNSQVELTEHQMALREEVLQRLAEQAKLSGAEICGEPEIRTTRPIWWDEEVSDIQRIWAFGVAHVKAPECNLTAAVKKEPPAFPPLLPDPEVQNDPEPEEPPLRIACDKMFLILGDNSVRDIESCLPASGTPVGQIFSTNDFSGSGQVRPRYVAGLPDTIRALLPRAGEDECDVLGMQFAALISGLPENAPARIALEGEERVFGADLNGNLVLCRKRDDDWIQTEADRRGYLVLDPDKAELDLQ